MLRQGALPVADTQAPESQTVLLVLFPAALQSAQAQQAQRHQAVAGRLGNRRHAVVNLASESTGGVQHASEGIAPVRACALVSVRLALLKVLPK